MTQKPQREVTGNLPTDPNRKGDIAEQYVLFIASLKGYECFPNIGSTGDADMIIKIQDVFVPVDVKLASYQKGGSGNTYCVTASAAKVELPVYAVIVYPFEAAGLPVWEVKWRVNRQKQVICPPGLEGAWS